MFESFDNKLLESTFDDLPVGIGIFNFVDLEDLESIRYVFMNKVLLYEMRKEREEVFGKRIVEVAPEAYEHEGGLLVIETYRKVAREGGSINLGLVEYSNHMVAGTYECSVHHIRDNYVYVMLRNVTELEKTKNLLEEKNKEVETFVNMVSHDLKAPLQNTLRLIELIDDSENFSNETTEVLKHICSSIKRAKNLVTELLTYSAIGEKKEMQSVDIAELLKKIQIDLSSKIKDTQTTLQIKGELPIIQGLKTELRLLFQNLISNAIKFRKLNSPPEILISVKKENGWTFSIEDNGIGMESKYLNQIFKAFHRLYSHDKYEGSGIGLASCKKIVDLHKGKIWVNSELGKGSSFFFTLPE